jgi:hypothetical protein
VRASVGDQPQPNPRRLESGTASDHLVRNVTDSSTFHLIQREPPEAGIMIFHLDIFKTETDGHLLWRAAVESFAAAKARIQELTTASPGEYIILDENTGHRALLGLSGTDGGPSAPPDASTQTNAR